MQDLIVIIYRILKTVVRHEINQLSITIHIRQISSIRSGPESSCHAASHIFPQVVDIMRVNVDKVLERDQKLSELDDRADALQAGASQFETSAAKLKNKYWWKNAKVRTCTHP